MLRLAGANVYRVGFNAGDRAFWFGAKGYIPYRDGPDEWDATFRAIVAENQITDIVLYGDTRPIHAQAVDAANELGLNVHVFEEDYMRPFWVTYERGGTNGNSKLMDTTVEDMRTALAQSELDVPIERRNARPTLAQLVHSVLIDYPRYFDPVSGLPRPAEVVVDRLENGTVPRPTRANRMLSKLQGVFASYAHMWR